MSADDRRAIAAAGRALMREYGDRQNSRTELTPAAALRLVNYLANSVAALEEMDHADESDKPPTE